MGLCSPLLDGGQGVTIPYYTLMTEKDKQIEAEGFARAAMETRCSDCGHVCGEETMTKYCDGWKEEMRDAIEEVRRLIVEERAAIAVGAPAPREERGA